MMKRFCKRTALALTLGAGAGLAAAGSADAATFGAVADTYTRDGVSAGSATDLDVRGFANDGSSDLPDFVAYVRFDISSLIGLDITDATLDPARDRRLPE